MEGVGRMKTMKIESDPSSGFARRLAGILMVVMTAGAAGCDNPFWSDSDTRIRLRNASAFELTAVTFAPGAPRLEFPRIAAGAVTPYRTVDGAFRYGYLDVLVDAEHRRLQPTDYVGERVIGGGRFTYVITIEGATRNPSVALVKDE